MPTATSTAADFESKGGLTRPNTSARNPLPDDGSHPGGIKSESRAASSRYRWATSSESACLPINDIDRIAGVVDEYLLAGGVTLAHGR